MSRRLWRPAYIGVGSNIETPLRQIELAKKALQDIKRCAEPRCSGLYRSEPFGPVAQPDFINGVIGIVTRLEPQELLRHLQAIEDDQGRDRAAERWGPRTLDLDLLACGSLIVDEEELQVPHPGIAQRNFVLLPWADVAPEFTIPGLGNVARLARGAPASPAIERID